TKMPRFPFDKFTSGDRELGTQMKATGEIMAVGRTFEESLLKGIRSLDIETNDLWLQEIEDLSEKDIENRLVKADDERIFIIAEALRRGMSLKRLHELTKIDYYFLTKIKKIINQESKLQSEKLTEKLLYETKQMGFSDDHI